MLELPVNTSITAAAGAAGGWPDAGRIPINSSVINMNSEWIDLIRTLPFGMNFLQLARLQRIYFYSRGIFAASCAVPATRIWLNTQQTDHISVDCSFVIVHSSTQ